tara:strand:+ start:21976 stop:23103 length:1128 start_codon:yes stop_codon:yes gene_type:complete
MSIEEYFISREYIKPLVTAGDLDALCLHALSLGSHELHITGGECPMMEINNRMYAISPRVCEAGELKELVRNAFSDRRLSNVLSGEEQDVSYDIKKSRDESERFRVNISAGFRHGDSISLAMRSIPTSIPTCEKIGLPRELVDECNAVERGVIVMAGATGTGKSTTMAALIKERLVNGGRSERFYSAEAPVEFLHNYEPSNQSTILQAEIGIHVQSFRVAVRNILRRNTSLFLLGETRDKETVEALMRAGIVGPLAYTTVHATSVSTIIPRMIGEFKSEERDAALSLVVNGVKVFCAQALLVRNDGSRVACREYLIVSNEVRSILEKATPTDVEEVVGGLLRTHGVSMFQCAQELYERGEIDNAQLRAVEREYGG